MGANVFDKIINGKAVSGQAPLICAPMVGQTKAELADEARLALDVRPDCVEWRADYFCEGRSYTDYIKTLFEIRKILPDIAVIFTLRAEKEGGFRPIDQQMRLKIINEIIKTEQIDMVDIELANRQSFINPILETAKRHGVYTIISSHYFQNTPDKQTLLQILTDEQNAGADIAKLAVMPASPADVLTLLDATNTFTALPASVPIITVSMGKLGVISRLGGGVFGSALTFGALKQSSAPGQVSVAELKNAMGVLYS